VQDIASTVAGLQAAPVIVGHSMGGLVVQKYLEKYQQHPSAVLLAPAPHTVIGTLRMLTPLVIKTPGAFVRFVAKLSLYEFVSTPGLARKMFFSASLPEKQVVSYFERLQEESLVFRPSQLAAYFPHPERVKTRILVLGAERDGAVPRQDVEATARAYHSEAEFFDTAHDMMLEPGWQQVADRIIEWMDTQARARN
jgi:pimeloyl-ACP methyl ester carboxylesterase